MTYQKVIIAGRLGTDPNTKATPKGTEFTRFTVATSRKHKETEETTWFSVTAFGKLGVFCAEHLAKGAGVFIEGRLTPDISTGGRSKSCI